MPDQHDFEKAQQEVEEYKAQEAERTKALAPYSDNLPYDRNRVIEETKFLLKHEIVAKYEIGKRLILLKENESCPKFGQLLEDHFPGLSRQRAYEYMLFARKIANLPKLQEFADGKKNWTKALALLESFDEDELRALEAGESIAGKTLDEYDTMTLKELKKTLRKRNQQIKDGQQQLTELENKNRRLQEELKEAQKTKLPDDEEAQLKRLIEIKRHFFVPYFLLEEFAQNFGKLPSRIQAEVVTLYNYMAKVAIDFRRELWDYPDLQAYNFEVGVRNLMMPDGKSEIPVGKWDEDERI